MISFNTQATSNKSKAPGQVTGVLARPQQSYAQPSSAPIAGVSSLSSLGNNKGVLPAHSNPTTPLKSLTTKADGSTTSVYHPTPAGDVKAGGTYTDTQGNKDVATHDPMTGKAYETPKQTPTPAPLTVGGQAPGVLATGGQTGNEATTFKGLVGQSQAPSQAYTDAGDKYQQAVKDLADFKMRLAETEKGINAEGISLDSSRGQIANIGQAAASELAAKQSAVTQQEQALSYANQQQGLQVQAGTAAQTGAQNQASRATTAASDVLGHVAPITGVQYGTQIIQPGQLGQTGGATGGIQPTDPYYKTLQNYAQMAATGQYSAIPASVTSNPVLNDQMNQMAKGINPQYNPITSAAQSGITAQQSEQVAGYQSALQQGQNLQAQLTDLIKTFGLNPNDINAANTGLQKIAQNVSDPHYKQLQNYVNDIANTYSQILTPPGGSSTDTSRGIATSMLDATASGSSILDTMKSLDEAAKAKIAGVPTSGNYGNNTSGGSTGGTMFGSFFGK